MKRLLIPAVSALALALAVPGAAVARGHHHHKKSHHAAKARVEHFGPKSTTAPTSTSPTSSDNAGTVKSFVAGTTPDSGVLTLTLNDGSTVSGNVTTNTEIECEAAAPMATTSDNHGDGGDNSGGGGDNQNPSTTTTTPSTTTTGTTPPSSTGGDESNGQTEPNDSYESNGNHGEGGDDQNEGQSAACTTADLTPGAVVHEADLRIGSSGAEFKSVKLVK